MPDILKYRTKAMAEPQMSRMRAYQHLVAVLGRTSAVEKPSAKGKNLTILPEHIGLTILLVFRHFQNSLAITV